MTPAEAQAAILLANLAIDLAVKGYAIAKQEASENEVEALESAMAALQVKAGAVAAYQPIQKLA